MELTKRHLENGSHHAGKRSAEFNLGAALDCPSYKLGYCQAMKWGQCFCYARKNEKRWPHVLSYHREQGRVWDSLTAGEFARQFLEINSRKRAPWIELEFNDAGDFRNQADVDKVQAVAKILIAADIFVLSFTARRDLDYSQASAIHLVGSGFLGPGIACELRTITRESDIPEGYEICLDCRTEEDSVCDKCWRGINVWTWVW